MNTKERVHQLVDESDDQILQAVEALLETYQKQKWSPGEIEDLNRDIATSEDEIESGHFITQEQVLKYSSEWKQRKL